MKRGNLLEDDALELAAEERPEWNIWQPRDYLSHPDWRIGCTPDAYYERYGGPEQRQRGVLQIKTVGKWAFDNSWKDRDTREILPPLWIAVQASIEAILSGRDAAAVGALVIGDGGLLDMHVIDIPLKFGLITTLRPRVQDFWRRVEQDDPYPIDWESDREAMLEVYRDSDGSQIDLSADDEVALWLDQRANFKIAEQAGAMAEKERKLIDAQIIERMGNAEIATFGGRIIKAATIRRGAYSVEPTQYRSVRIKEAK